MENKYDIIADALESSRFKLASIEAKLSKVSSMDSIVEEKFSSEYVRGGFGNARLISWDYNDGKKRTARGKLMPKTSVRTGRWATFR
jgi:hypothetical protein